MTPIKQLMKDGIMPLQKLKNNGKFNITITNIIR